MNITEPICVLHILQRMEAAGVQSLLMNLYKYIDPKKIRFDFLVHYSEDQFYDEEVVKMGGRIHKLTVREDFNLPRYYMNLKKIFCEHPEYQIVHGHMHSLGAIYLHVAKECRIPVRVAHAHIGEAVINDWKKPIKDFMITKYTNSATHLFACSKQAGDYMFQDKPYRIFRNAIDADKFIFSQSNREKMRAELGLTDKIVIGNVGRFTYQKNQSFAARVFKVFHKRHPNAVLLLIGEGEEKRGVENYVQTNGLSDCVRFLGVRKDINRLFLAMDAFLFPSRYEGLGIVCIEAQAAGTPIVCTDTLPEELNISPLIQRCSLLENETHWVELLEKAIINPAAHKIMRSTIINEGYDIKRSARELQEFYLSTVK